MLASKSDFWIANLLFSLVSILVYSRCGVATYTKVNNYVLIMSSREQYQRNKRSAGYQKSVETHHCLTSVVHYIACRAALFFGVPPILSQSLWFIKETTGARKECDNSLIQTTNGVFSTYIYIEWKSNS